MSSKEECWKRPGKSQAGVKWSDANKGDKENPENHCRLVAKEVEKDTREDLFAVTPPSEAKKMLFSLWASMPGMRLDFGDAVRACFQARAKRRVYAELSRGDHERRAHGMLKTETRGARDAAQNWEFECCTPRL